MYRNGDLVITLTTGKNCPKIEATENPNGHILQPSIIHQYLQSFLCVTLLCY